MFIVQILKSGSTLINTQSRKKGSNFYIYFYFHLERDSMRPSYLMFYLVILVSFVSVLLCLQFKPAAESKKKNNMFYHFLMCRSFTYHSKMLCAEYNKECTWSGVVLLNSSFKFVIRWEMVWGWCQILLVSKFCTDSVLGTGQACRAVLHPFLLLSFLFKICKVT